MKGKFSMRDLKKIIAMAASAVVTMGIAASASAFSDMPGGEMGAALQRAVDVKLMNGVTDDLIAPNDNITRAQMATILVRAFAATETSEAAFNDVAPDAWYADMVSKAAKMGAFQGDDYNNFNPENNITFQETYIVLSRMFGFEPYEVTYKSKPSIMLGDVDASVLSAFADASEFDSWAYNYGKYIVGNGGWKGIDGMLKPKAYITRGEFAMLMNALVTTYIDAPGTYNSLPSGLTMVRSGGVTIDGFTNDSNLVFTYAVNEDGAKVTNSTINGVTLVLGGVDKTPRLNESSGKYSPDEAYISIAGNFHDVRNSTAFVMLDASNAAIEFYKGVDNSLVALSFGL